MASHEAFLADIAEHPDDDAPRLIYADWLDDHGGDEGRARAEFIRAQCELYRLDRPDNPLDVMGHPAGAVFRGEFQWCQRALWSGDAPEVVERRQLLLTRQRQLWEAHGETWLAAIPRWAREHCRFERGFLGGVHVRLAQFVKSAGALVRRHPVRHVSFADAVLSRLDELGDCPALASFRSLNLDGLGGSPDAFGARGAFQLAASPYLPPLTALSLVYQGIAADGVRALLARAELGGLRGLGLMGNFVYNEGAGVLARSAPPALAALDLNANGIEGEGVALLAGASSLANLTHLFLADNDLGVGGAQALASATWLPRLACLSLRGTGLNNIAVTHLTRAPAGALRALDLGANRVGDAGAEALARWPGLSSVTALSLSRNEICAAGAKALADSPHVTELRILNLGENRIGDDGVRALANSKALVSLESLLLADNRISSEALLALARSDNLLSLQSLQVNTRAYSTFAVDALRRRFMSVY